MEKEFHVVAARAVFAYLYDHEMYSLAKEFCTLNPYLEADRDLLQQDKTPSNSMGKPLHIVMQDFIVMESILLQLVSLCSDAIDFPDNCPLLELGDYLIKVLRASGTGQVLKAVVSTLPVCTDWSETQPQTVPPTVAKTPAQIGPDGSFSADHLFGHDIVVTASEMSMLETITRCAESNTVPTLMESMVFSGQPAGAVKTSGIITLENIPPAGDTQSNLFSTSTPSTSKTAVSFPYQSNQPNRTSPPVALQPVRAVVPTATNAPPPNVAANQLVPNVPKEHAEKIPPPGGTLSLATGATTRSNGTPLDHPIVPGTVSSRSNSSRKHSHIRILDFGTPSFKRASPSTYGPSPALNVPQPTVPVEKLTPAAELAARKPAPVPTASVEPKPKKVIVKRRLKRVGMRPQIKRMIVPSTLKVSNRELVKRYKMLKNKARLQQTFKPTAAIQAPIGSKSNSNDVQTKESACTTNNAPTVSVSPAKALLNAFRPPSASPPRTAVPGSPACPVDPLALCPMTPRFLTRPLQPLCMLSPLLGTLDASAVSQIKSISHSKRATDINTPGYPITPGNAITPSPPPDSVSYYESKPGTVDSARKGDVADSAMDDSDADSRSSGAPKPHLTLTASEGSAEIAIRYVESERTPPAVEHLRELADQLAARIEIDNGNRVFQIAVSPIIKLYEDLP